jgi:signal transduction histidine kinase
MVPYRGRFALRVARVILSLICAAWFLQSMGWTVGIVLALFAAHAIFSVLTLIEMAHDTPPRSALAMVMDAGYFLIWVSLAPDSWPAAFACAFLLASAALTQDWIPSAAAGGVAILLSLVVPPGGPGRLAVTVSAMVSVASVLTVYRRYLEQRMSTTLRHNVIIRSQAQGAREAERQRIAADFHDGPLQSFVGFQMRLELIRRLLEKRPEQGMDELRLLQELCKSQVTDLRAFVRSMRPADEGMSLAASLSRMTDSLQRDTGISATFEGEELHDPPEVEISLEILQIVREAFNNIQKHSGATQMKLSAHRRGRNVELAIADNGSGFPFAGAFTLDELDAARMGPVSIKRRIRMLAGELAIESRPGEGATLTFRVPF